MDGQIPTPPNIGQSEQVPSPISSLSSQTPKEKRGILFEIVFVAIFLALIFGILNYFNILKLSELFPNQLGFLPHRTYQQSQQPSNVTLSPSNQAKQTLINFLPTILAPSLFPATMSNVTIKNNEAEKDSYIASWRPKEGIVRVGIQGPLGSKKFMSIDLFYNKEKIQSPSPTVELAKSEINQIFSIRPKGTWRCKNFTDTTLYCENFWDESDDLRKGLGYLLITTKTKGRVIYSFCEHTKDSNLYPWKSCRAEFAKTGVQ